MSWLIAFNILVTVAFSQGLTTIPNTCSDLLPDIAPYIDFFEQTGDLWYSESPSKAKKIYDVLAVRKLYQDTTTNSINPIDGLIKKYLCSCYAKNNKTLFSANSSVIRKCLNKDLDKLIKDAKKEFKKMMAEKRKDDKAIKLSDETRQRIKRSKDEAMKDMEHELGQKDL